MTQVHLFRGRMPSKMPKLGSGAEGKVAITSRGDDLALKRMYMGVSQNWGYHFCGPHTKGYSILGSILGSPYFEKLPYSHRPVYVTGFHLPATGAN